MALYFQPFHWSKVQTQFNRFSVFSQLNMLAKEKRDRIADIIKDLIDNQIAFSLRYYKQDRMITEIFCKHHARAVCLMFPKEFTLSYDNHRSEIALASFEF